MTVANRDPTAPAAALSTSASPSTMRTIWPRDAPDSRSSASSRRRPSTTNVMVEPMSTTETTTATNAVIPAMPPMSWEVSVYWERCSGEAEAMSTPSSDSTPSASAMEPLMRAEPSTIAAKQPA